MKQIIAILMLACAGVAGAQTSDTKPTTPKKQTKAAVEKKPAPPTAKPLTIPDDAVANADGSYSYTDQSGKKWLYNKTPFGVSKIEDMGTAPSPFATTAKDQLIKATDSGDTVKFERQTPFGTTRWEKKKSELTDDERHIFESQQPKPEPQPE